MKGSLALFLACMLGAPSGAVQRRREDAIDDYKKERTRVLALAGQRHLEYGLELRRKGLTTQAAAQIVLAVEVAQGRNPGAEVVLGVMRTYQDAFWKRKIEKPSDEKLAAYAARARKLRQEDHEACLELVEWALRADLEEQAYEELRALLLALDEPLAFDARGRLLVLGDALGAEPSERVRAGAIEINGRPYVRDAFLRRVPEVARIFEKSSPELRVRSTRSLEEAENLHAAAAQLLPILRADLGAAPDRRLQLVVLGERKHYHSFLEQGAGPEIAARFERWRALCFGSAAGADFDRPYQTESAASSALFREMFAQDLGTLEEAFGVWLKAL
jgi:hypothetical protein